MIKAGFLGPTGTHSEEAALYLNQKSMPAWELVPCTGIYDAIMAVANGELDRCIVPVENSIEGSINITLDTLAHKVDLEIEQELVWPVHNHLMVKNPQAKWSTVLSHPQPLAQCREYLKKHYKEAEIRQVSSTARAAAIASADPACAAVGTRRAAEIYGLHILAEEIQDDPGNCTRFFVLKRRDDAVLTNAAKALLICQIDGQKAGSLCDVLLELAHRGVNMTRIESRPAKTGLGVYVFFLELDAGVEKEILAEAIEAVRQKSLWLKNMGTFPVETAELK